MQIEVDPKVDYAFKRVFGHERNRDILISLVNAVLLRSLGRPIIEVAILNPFSNKDAEDDKSFVLDIKARDDSGRMFNVEMQVLTPAEIRERLLYYWAGIFIEQLTAGEKFKELKPTISICFSIGSFSRTPVSITCSSNQSIARPESSFQVTCNCIRLSCQSSI